MRLPTRRDILRLGGAAAASALFASGAGRVGSGRMEAHPYRHAALVRPEATGDRDSRHLAAAVEDRVRRGRARECVRQVGRRMAEASRRGEAQAVRVPPPARGAAGRQACRNRRVQPGGRQPEPDHSFAASRRLQVGRPAEEDRRRGERGRGKVQAAQDAGRVPQPHDRLQSHRRRILVEPSSPIGPRRTSSSSSTPATRRRWQA